MNKYRRSILKSVIERLETAIQKIESVKEDEQEAYDNLPDNLNDTDRANDMYENVDDMEDAVSSLQDIIDQLQEIIDR